MTKSYTFSPKASERYEELTGNKPEEVAGLRFLAFSRSTGELVGTYDGTELDDSFDLSEGSWVTICEDHNMYATHESLKVARYMASCPDVWCDESIAATSSTVGTTIVLDQAA